MRKIFVSISFVLFLLFTFAHSTSAQIYQLEQFHSYTVIFRNNDEAITFAKIALTNNGKNALNDFSFEIPGVVPTETAIYQMKLPPECVEYDTADPNKPCLRYRDRNYSMKLYPTSYSLGETGYSKLEYKKSDNQYNFKLQTPLEPDKSTAFFIIYTTQGYARNNLGLRKFTFETFKIATPIIEARVVVEVDKDLKLKARHPFTSSTGEQIEIRDIATFESLTSRGKDEVVRKAGYNKYPTREADNLSSNETLIVEGQYASNWLRLYLSSILSTLLIIGVVFVLAYLKEKFSKGGEGQGGALNQGKLTLRHTSISLISVVAVALFTYSLGLFLESEFIDFLTRNFIFIVLGFITVIFFYILLALGPVIIIGIKYGRKSAALTFTMVIFWFAVFYLIYLLLFRGS